MTDTALATRDPELAVLSVMAHGLSPEAEALARVVLHAIQGLDVDRQVLYSDLVRAAVGATRVALEELMASGNYIFQSDFAKSHQAKGREEGLAELDARGLVFLDEQRAHIRACSDEAQLDAWLRRAVSVESVSDLFR